MKLHVVVVLLTMSCCVLAYNNCKQKAIQYFKRPVYNFTIQLVQRVAEDTQSNFVFSPLTTWLQLYALAEGATNETFKEIQQVMRIPRVKCFKRNLKNILHNLNRNLKYGNRRKSIMVIDKLLAVKRSFMSEARRLYDVDVLLMDFYTPGKSSMKVNKKVNDTTGGAINHILYDSDFDSTVLLMSDANYFNGDWLMPFDTTLTKTRNFYEMSGNVIEEVTMMEKVARFNMVEIELLNAKILEIPFANSEISMLVFLPMANSWVGEIFYSLERTNIRGILNYFKRFDQKLVNVTIPKFDQRSELDIFPELLYDMGIRKIFDPKEAELKRISRYPTYASLMTQICRIEVNEGSVSVTELSESIINDDAIVESFTANRPFAYMIVDKNTEFILYAGMYLTPEKIYNESDNNV